MNNEDLKKESLEKAGAYEVMSASKGWEKVLSHIQEQITNFTNRSLLDGFKTIEDYQYARGYVNGLRELLVEVQSSLDELNRFRDSERAKNNGESDNTDTKAD
jgi:hypothetical protein